MDNKENTIPEKDKDKILYLFFQRVWSLEKIEEYFKGKYKYSDIRKVTKDKFKASWEKQR